MISRLGMFGIANKNDPRSKKIQSYLRCAEILRDLVRKALGDC